MAHCSIADWQLAFALYTHTYNDIKERCGRGKEKSEGVGGGAGKGRGSKASLISLKRKVTSFVQASLAMISIPRTGRGWPSAHPFSFADQTRNRG